MYIYWQVISKDMDQYIRYHKQPYAKYLDVKAFNEKFGTNIPDVEDYDAYFHFVFTEARKMQGPSEFLLVKFANHDEFKNMGKYSDYFKKKANETMKKIAGTKAFKAAKEAAKAAGKAAKAAGKAAGKAIDKKLDEAAEARLKKKEKSKKAAADDKPKKANSAPPVQPEVNDLDELLSEEENIVEEEYDEVAETETSVASPEPKVKNIVTEKKKIADMVLKASKDSEEYHQDMKHLIQFKSSKLPLEAQLMKGRPKYLKALRAYLKGDKDAEVKMSWRKKRKMVGKSRI